MNNLIKKIQSNIILTILTALSAGIIVHIVSKFFAQFTVPFIEEFFKLSFYTKNTISKLYMLVLSILLILIINNGHLKNYGFKKPKNVKYLKMTLITIGVTVGSVIFGSLLFMGVLNHFFPAENTAGFPEQKSLVEMILTVWIWSSICEEVLVRGLVQSFMQHLKSKKFLGLSLPVIISGLFFGAMHLSLLFAGKGHWFVCSIVFFTTTIGFLAAYYREKSGSIIPPIIIHFTANVVGSIPLIITLLIS